MIRPCAEFEDARFMLGVAQLLGVEELEKLIVESEKNLLPCPCCGREKPEICYGYDRGLHCFSIVCPGTPMSSCQHNLNYNGCGNCSGTLFAKEDEDLADFKEAIRYITEAWNRRTSQ